MSAFPKLRYPIHTKGLSLEERNFLLAYDMIYKAKIRYEKGAGDRDPDYENDLEANLKNLGFYIEHNLCGGDMALRFEGFDKE